MVFPYYLNNEEMTIHVWETFNWHLKSVARPPRPLPKNYRELCLDFILANAEKATRDFHIPKLVQATFCSMVVNEALGLGVLSRSMTKDLKSAPISL